LGKLGRKLAIVVDNLSMKERKCFEVEVWHEVPVETLHDFDLKLG
jgi:hypothetical protein